MKIKSILMLMVSMLFFNIHVDAQLTIQFNAINEYAFNTREALNLTAIHPGVKSFEIEFRGKISSGDGQRVVEFKTDPIVLNPGANAINPMTVGIREQIYFNQDIAEIESKTGTYPSGNYTICIWSACVQADCNGAGQDAGSIETPVCTQIHVENPTPLLLAFPENNSEIEETRPLYTWIPPAPVAGSASLNYTMLLVEVMEGQNIADALQLNRPLIDMQNIGNPMLMHASDLDALEPGKTYAWQVEAFVGRTSIGKSEQWKFKVKKKEEKKDTMRYVKLTSQKTSDFYSVNKDDVLYFTFDGEYRNSQFTMIVYDDNNNVIKNTETIEKTTDNKPFEYTTEYYGEYKMFIDLKDLILKSGRFYSIVLTDKENKKYYLKFLII